jgi:hypothetical protein
VAVGALQSGDPGEYLGLREVLARFTNAGSAPPRHAAAHEFAGMVNGDFIGPIMQASSHTLQETDSGVSHQSLRDSMWVDTMLIFGISDKNSSSPNASTPTPCGRARSAAPTLLRSRHVPGARRLDTASAPTVSIGTGPRPRQPSLTKSCVIASRHLCPRQHQGEDAAPGG